jgi:F0F1-type ATP synthase membrane subunit b/b'
VAPKTSVDPKEKGTLDRFDELLERLAEHNVNYSEEEIERDIEAAREEIAAEKRKGLQGSPSR